MKTSKYIGVNFGELKVVDVRTEYTKTGHPVQVGKVACACGKVYETRMSNLIAGRSKKCMECFKKECKEQSEVGCKHEYQGIWRMLVDRCYNKKSPSYPRYGAKGIGLGDEWLGERKDGELATMDGFRKFVVDMGDRPEGYRVRRLDESGDYAPGNCTWSPPKDVVGNKEKHKEATKLKKTEKMLRTAAEKAERMAEANAKRHAAYMARHNAISEIGYAHIKPSTKRNGAKTLATPVWGCKYKIDALYNAAYWLSVGTGAQHHVDHIVPLQSDLVCGLHVEHNLRVMVGADNSSKGNRHWPDMPE